MHDHGRHARTDVAMSQGAPGRIRTCDARFRKPTLYPLSYEGGAWREASPVLGPGSNPAAARIVEPHGTANLGFAAGDATAHGNRTESPTGGPARCRCPARSGSPVPRRRLRRAGDGVR